MTELSFEDAISHYGIRGMKWGVRRTKKQIQETPVEVSAKPGQKVKARGGTGQKASEDAIRVASTKQKAKASTTDALSTKELQELVNRMNLEQQYSKLTGSQKSSGKKFIDNLLDSEMKAAKAGTDSPAFIAGKAVVAVIKKASS